jgi:hypothetical protein
MPCILNHQFFLSTRLILQSFELISSFAVKMKALRCVGFLLVLLAHSIAADRGEPPKVDLHEIITDYRCDPHKIQIKDTCHKNKSDNNPFCSPSSNDLWYSDASYYVTWDAEFCDDGCTLALQYGNPDALDDKVDNEVVDLWNMEKGKGAQIVVSVLFIVLNIIP